MASPIKLNICCNKCNTEKPSSMKTSEYQNNEIGIIDDDGVIIMVWCKRHDIHVATLYLSESILFKGKELIN